MIWHCDLICDLPITAPLIPDLYIVHSTVWFGSMDTSAGTLTEARGLPHALPAYAPGSRLWSDQKHVSVVHFHWKEMDHTDMFLIRSQSATRGHSWKLFPRHCRTLSCVNIFFCEHVIASWNCIDINSENLRSTISFKRFIKESVFSQFLYYS